MRAALGAEVFKGLEVPNQASEPRRTGLRELALFGSLFCSTRALCLLWSPRTHRGLSVTIHRGCLLLLCILTAPVSLAAQPTSVRPLVPSPAKKEQQVFGPAPAVPAAARGIHDRGELGAFLDGVMAANLRDKHVA